MVYDRGRALADRFPGRSFPRMELDWVTHARRLVLDVGFDEALEKIPPEFYFYRAVLAMCRRACPRTPGACR